MDGQRSASTPEELWRLTLQHSPVGMTLVAPDGTFLAVNDALCGMLGHDARTLRSMTFQEITHPDDLNADVDRFERLIAGEIPSYRMLKRYWHADGSLVWGDLSVAVLRDEHGEAIHAIAQVLDVSEQRRDRERRAEVEARMLDQGRRVAAVFDSVDVGLLLLDAEGRYESVNRRLREFLALAFPEGHEGRAGMTGRVFAEDGTTPMTSEDMPSTRAAAGGEFDDVRIWVGPPKDLRALSVSARSIHDVDGRLTGAALAYKDVTDYLRVMAVKDDFLAMVSHELRTPLTSVLGHLELLGDGSDLPYGVAHQIAVVDRNARRLDGLVADLLEVARQRTSAPAVERRDVELGGVAREAVEAARPAATDAGIELVTDLAGSVLAHVDPGRVRQVLDNLLSNAVKYSGPGGRVCLSLACADGEVLLAVADTGPGIDAGELDRLFDRFFRGRSARAQHVPGTGLGLGIVRTIVEAHGGTVAVASVVGEGTTVTVRLPQERPLRS